MGRHFGDLAFIRGIIYYRISPHEVKPLAKAIKYGIPNFYTRAMATAWTWVPAFASAGALYYTIENKYRQQQRKNPNDYENEVDPNENVAT